MSCFLVLYLWVHPVYWEVKIDRTLTYILMCLIISLKVDVHSGSKGGFGCLTGSKIRKKSANRTNNHHTALPCSFSINNISEYYVKNIILKLMMNMQWKVQLLINYKMLSVYITYLNIFAHFKLYVYMSHVPCPINTFWILYLIEFVCLSSPYIIVKLRAAVSILVCLMN